jgi:ubiquinone/menaquinone biosynthesis C-methylase UbiE
MDYNIESNIKNPWLEISHSDYENHMTEVGQAQVLNDLTKNCLEKYKPGTFTLLGCSTGNGLEHVKAGVTRNVYAIDINAGYLQILWKKFENKIGNLITFNIDIRKDELKINNTDLLFAGLILEYVEPKSALLKIIRTLNKNGVLVIVIQKNKQTSFVSKTKYKSLKKLYEISNEVIESEIDEFLKLNNLERINRNEIKLTENKSLISLEYRMIR